MKLRELLREYDSGRFHDDDDNVYDVDEIAQKIVTDCKPFLKQSKFDPEDANMTGLFRGMHMEKMFDKFSIRDNRSPANTNASIHRAMDDGFHARFGIAYRSQSAFASGFTRALGGYGSIHLMFPIGDFKFCWSPKIHDAYNIFDDEGDPQIFLDDKEFFPPELKKIVDAHSSWPSEYIERVYEYISDGDAGYKETDLPEAIKSRHEIMIAKCDYYMLRHSNHGESDMMSEAVMKKMKELM